jgi:hypothetical protein
MQRRFSRQSPEDDDKGRQRYNCAQQADTEIQRCIDEQFDVVGDALIRVIGRIPLKLHAVVVRVVQPLTQIFSRHPLAPADLEPLIEVELIDRQHDAYGCQHTKDDGFPDKAVPVLLLQGVVETIAPLVEQHAVCDQCQLDRNHRSEQHPAGKFVLGAEIRHGDSPYGRECRSDLVHGRRSPKGLERGWIAMPEIRSGSAATTGFRADLSRSLHKP